MKRLFSLTSLSKSIPFQNRPH
uniref:Uncharacterized protein n=1 Tax=Arundo donax TaxID=35708 RepID=A0A0A9BK65_ARUDO